MRTGWCVPLLMLAVAPAAPAGQQGSAAAERFRAMDRNGDRVISRDEWRGSERSFAVHDWNRDGVLSGDEVRLGGRNQQRLPDDPGGDASEPFADWTAERFEDLDHNRDGKIATDEWHFERELFRRVDLDRDGFLSRREFLGLGPDDDRDDRFADLDANRDGRVSGQEWHADPEVFGALDRDRNGFLSRDELTGPGDDAPVDLFGSLDVNRDGRVARNEWHWSRGSFDTRDRDRDGSLSREELSAAGSTAPAAQRSPAYRAGYDRGMQDGRVAGREDRARNRWDLDGQRELEQADAGYAPVVGSRPEYQAGYREGFTRGYGEGFGPRR